MATPEPQVVPFVGGEVFNPANFVRITNMDEASWGRFVPGSVIQGGQLSQPIWMSGPSKLAKQAIAGRYNGKDYVFPYGQAVNVPVDVARHIFGFLLDDKSAALTRLGWVRSSDEMDSGMERLGNIRFEDLPELMEAARFVKEIAHASGLVKGDDAAEGTPAVPSNASSKKA